MSRFPDVSPASARPRAGFQETGGLAEQKEFSASRRMDAGLTIKTREGDIVTLSSSRFSSLNTREYTSSYSAENGGVSARNHERQIQLASGETFAFSVQGDLNEQELADIEAIISGIDGIIYEMAQGNMDGAVAKALSMKSYDSVSMYEADISVARSYAGSVQAVSQGAKLPDSYGKQGLPAVSNPLPSLFSSPFMDQVSQLLKDQEAQALAHARQPLGRLFDHYLDQAQTSPSSLASSEPQSESSPLALALESTAKMVDQLIQSMVKDAFGHTLDQMA